MKSRQAKNNSLRKKCKQIKSLHRKTKLIESRLCISNQTLEATNNIQLNKLQILESNLVILVNMNTEFINIIMNMMNTLNTIDIENIELLNRITNLEKQVKSKSCYIM